MEIEFKSKPRACFEVEKIIGMSSDGSFQVQWAPTWVSKFHLVGCEHLIKEFLQQKQQTVKKKNTPELLVEPANVSKESSVKATGGIRELKQGVQKTFQSIHDDVKAEIETTPVEKTRGQHDVDDGSWPHLSHVMNLCGTDTASANFLPDDDTPQNSLEVSIKIEEDNEFTATAESLSLPVLPPTSSFLDSARDGIDISGEHNSASSELNAPWTLTEHHSSGKSQLCQKTSQRCQKTINRSSSLQQGPGSGMKKKLFICSYCNSKFISKGDLKRHLRTHTGEKPFPCDYCDKKFRVKGHLVRHTRLHTGNKPYSCDVCGKTFAQSHHRNLHASRCTSVT